MALATGGAVWAWGTFRDASGVYGFSPSERIALLPTLVHAPAAAADRVVKISSGAHVAWAAAVSLGDPQPLPPPMEHSVRPDFEQGLPCCQSWTLGRLCQPAAACRPGASAQVYKNNVIKGLRGYQTGPFGGASGEQRRADLGHPNECSSSSSCFYLMTKVLRCCQARTMWRPAAQRLTWGTSMITSSSFSFNDPRAAAVPGADHVAALTAGGAVLTWGTSGQGQLGRVGPRLRDPKPTLLRPAPVAFRRSRALRAVRVTDVACGIYATFALAEGGHVFAWGLNNYGQLALEGQVLPAARAGSWKG